MMKKQDYFLLVSLAKEYRGALTELTQQWNEEVCWSDDNNLIELHETREQAHRVALENLEAQMKEARKDIPQEVLRAWSKEYNNR